MLAVVPLKCANCSANLEVTAEMTSFACGYCGASQVVERGGGTISLRLIENAIGRVQVGTDKTAAELALKRLGNEMQALEQAHYRLRIQGNSEHDFNRKLFGGLWIGGVVFLLFVSATGKGGAVIALILGLLGTAGILFLGFKQSAVIDSRITDKETELFRQGNELQRKIALNRKLVDS